MNGTGTRLAWPVLRMPEKEALRLEGSTAPGIGEHMHVFHQSAVRFKRGCGPCAHSPDQEAEAPRPHHFAGGERPAHTPPLAHLLVPDLQGLAADAVEDGEEAALERVLEHLAGRGPAAALGPGLEIGTERRKRAGAAGPKEGH